MLAMQKNVMRPIYDFFTDISYLFNNFMNKYNDDEDQIPIIHEVGEEEEENKEPSVSEQ